MKKERTLLLPLKTNFILGYSHLSPITMGFSARRRIKTVIELYKYNVV